MRVGEYELTQKIGAGGMGEVWLGRRAATDGFSKTVAVKFPPSHPGEDGRARRDFVREVQLSMHLSHSNIVQVFDVGEVDGRLFMVMEWVDGCDVWRLLGFGGGPSRRVSIQVAAHITGELLRALEYAHTLRHEGRELGIVHRDVSPHNVLISTSGEVKLTDFGVARTLDEETSGLYVPGKLRYMAPEQFQGARRSRAMDLYAVGAVLHELLSRDRFRGAAREGELYRLILEGNVPSLDRDDIPPQLEALRRSLLAADPSRRPASAREALTYLEQIEVPGPARRELGELCRALTGVEGPRSGIYAAVPGERDLQDRARDAPDEEAPTDGQTQTLERPGDAAAPLGQPVSTGRASAVGRVGWLGAVGFGLLTAGAGATFAVFPGMRISADGDGGVASLASPDMSASVEQNGVAAPASDGTRAVSAVGAAPATTTTDAPITSSTPREDEASVLAATNAGATTEPAQPRAREDVAISTRAEPAALGRARVTFRASDYDFAYVRVRRKVAALEPRATLELPAGHHAVYMRERAEGSWRRIGAIRLRRDQHYDARLRTPGRVELQVRDAP